MPPKSWGYFLELFGLLILLDLCQGTDVFCGQLTIYKQQWFAKDTQTLGARTSTDLKDCLNFCCGIPDCQAVTFMGFLKNSPSSTANCVMFTCPAGKECQSVTDPIATDGVVSVFIKRDGPAASQLQSKDETVDLLNNGTSSSSTNQTMSDASMAETTPNDENTPAPTIVFGVDDDDNEGPGPVNPESTQMTKSLVTIAPPTTVSSTQRSRGSPRTTTQSILPSTTEVSSFLSNLAPIWVIGILIVLTVTCAGTCLVLLSVYCCVRRSKTKMRSQPITSLKASTIHAFNPNNLHTTSTMA